MSTPLQLIVEELIFSPLLFLAFLAITLLLGIRNKKFTMRYNHKRLWGLWGFLLFATSDLCFQIFSYPLKQLTPLSQKKQAEAIVVASAGVHASGAPTHGSTIRAHAAAALYLEGWAPLIIISGGVTNPYRPSSSNQRDAHYFTRGRCS